MTAFIDAPAPATRGSLYATGTENAGFSFFVQDGRLVFDYNAFGDHQVVDSDREVPVGEIASWVQVRRTGARTGSGRGS